jgi:hypothetical protein
MGGVSCCGGSIDLPPADHALARLRFSSIFRPSDFSIEPTNDPTLKTEEIFAGASEHHRIRLDSAFDHLSKPIPDARPGFLGIASDQHVGHQSVRRYSGSFQPFDALKENSFVSDIVPGGVEFPFAEAAVTVLDRRKRFGRLLTDETSVDALPKADPEMSVLDFAQTRSPIGISEEVVVEQQELFGPRLASPDLGDGV